MTSACQLNTAPPAAVTAPKTLIPGLIGNEPGFRTQPTTVTVPAVGTRITSPGLAGVLRQPSSPARPKGINIETRLGGMSLYAPGCCSFATAVTWVRLVAAASDGATAPTVEFCVIPTGIKMAR